MVFAYDCRTQERNSIPFHLYPDARLFQGLPVHVSSDDLKSEVQTAMSILEAEAETMKAMVNELGALVGGTARPAESQPAKTEIGRQAASEKLRPAVR